MKFSCFPILAIFFCALTGCAGVPAPASTCPWDGQKTIIKDEAEARLLPGRHVFTDPSALAHDIYWKNTMPGNAWITKNSDDRYDILAQYETHADELCEEPYPFGESLNIVGTISEIRSYEFDVAGTLSAGFYRNPEAERVSGVFTFSRQGHDDYWSLQDDISPRSVEYYFRKAILSVSDDPSLIFNKEKALKDALAIEKKCRKPY
ncbi:MAG: hypothetical protein H6858_01890 [Rhodospirillales bacterium]|nr:hypothetical protein [Rhodospirillales bacterium]